MSTTSNLKLNKHDNVSTNTNPFDIENYLNVNWDKIDKYAGNSNSTILKLQEENTRLKETIKTELEEKTIEAESIEVNDSAEANCEIDLQGNTTQEASPNPDYPSKVETVTGSVEVKIRNKNKSHITQITETQNNGITFTPEEDKSSVVLNGTATANASKWLVINSDRKKIEQGEYYLSSCKTCSNDITLNVGILDSNNKLLFSVSEKGTPVKFTITETSYINNYLLVAKGKEVLNKEIKIMIVKANADAENYVPHKQQTHLLYLPFELCKIGDYKDYIFKENNKWYKHKVIEKKQIIGANFQLTDEAKHYGWNTGNLFENLYFPIVQSHQNKALAYCDKFSIGTSKDTMNNVLNTIAFSKWDNRNWLYMSKEQASTTDEANAQLNGSIIYYVLLEPVDEEITDTTLIQQLNELENTMSYYGITYVDTTNEVIKPILKFTYNRSNRLRIENLEKAIINS